MKAVFYQSIGPELSRYDIDVDGAALTRRDCVATPGANVQYVWPHPSKKYLYVVSSDGGPGHHPRHQACRERVPHRSGVRRADAARRARQRCRRGRCIAASTAPGEYPADRLQLSEQHHRASHQAGRHDRRSRCASREKLDVGIFAHQVLTTPGNRTAILVTRGNNADGRASRRTPARSRSMASRTAC